MTRGFNYLIMIPTMCRLKFFSDIGSPQTTRYSLQLYASAILMAFITKGQYPFFPRISGRKSDNAQCRSTSPIPQLYAAVSARLLNILFPFSFYPSLYTYYWLHIIRITSNCNNRIVILSYNFNVAITPETKRCPFVFLYIFDIN